MMKLDLSAPPEFHPPAVAIDGGWSEALLDLESSVKL